MQDKNLPPGYREELDDTTCEHGLKEGDFCNICDN